MQAVAGELAATAGRHAGQGRDVDVGHVGLATFVRRHGVELVDFEPDGGRVAPLALAVGRLPLVRSREHNYVGRPPAGEADGLPQ